MVHLDDRDVASSSARPSPAAFVLPRTSMLLSILPDVLTLFSPYCACGLSSYSTQVWFSFEGVVPVDWTYPVGAVKDYIAEVRRNRREAQEALGRPCSAKEGADTCAVNVDALAPLELVFRIRQPASAKLIERRVPFFINFDRLDDFIRNEVRQVHKAAYTAMYGSVTLYQRTPAAALRPAEGIALYRPFHADLAAPPSSMKDHEGILFSSPHLVSEYQHLLRELLGRRSAAFLVKLGFPFAYCTTAGAGGGAIVGGNSTVNSSADSNGFLTFPCHRVSAAPPLVTFGELLHQDESGPPSSSAAATTATTTTATPTEAVADHREEAVTLGLLMWRLFRVPCLRWWLSKPHSPEGGEEGGEEGTPSGDGGGRFAYEALLRCLAERYYADAPAVALEQLERQDSLKAVPTGRSTQLTFDSSSGGGGTSATGGSAQLQPVPWASWESSMAARFTRDYDCDDSGDDSGGAGVGRCRGLSLQGERFSREGRGSDGPSDRRILFEVQGTQPLMRTPVKTLETLMSSSDRAIYITIRVI